MRNAVRICLLALLFLPCALNLKAQDANGVGLVIMFRQDAEKVDRTFENNGAKIDAFMSRLKEMMAKGLKITDVEIVGYSSVEGRLIDDENRAASRAVATLEYIRGRLDVKIPDSLFTVTTESADWDGLASAIEASNMPRKESVLDIIYNEDEGYRGTNGVFYTPRKDRLKELNGGEEWKYLKANFFPAMHRSTVYVNLSYEGVGVGQSKKEDITVTEDIPVFEDLSKVGNVTVAGKVDGVGGIVDGEVKPQEGTTPEVKVDGTVTKMVIVSTRPINVAIKTNLLRDALLDPDLGMEFCLGNRLSFATGFNYAFKKNNKNHPYWKKYGGYADLRIWLGTRTPQRRLSGHHIGLYGQISTYNFDTETLTIGSVRPKFTYVAGLSYGYSVPLVGPFNLDFTVGMGYMNGLYYEYKLIDGENTWKPVSEPLWVGSARAEISLVWIIGRNKTGGAR